MTETGIESNPLRVAIIGSGPAAFYATEHFFKQTSLVVEIDMYDRLPTPFGLVRAGVAPDHQKIKSVTAVYNRTASNPRFRFFGNVEIGKHLSVPELQQHYHQILFATGAQTDKRMGIPGEDLRGSHPATEFVAWYNGHPDFRDREFDLSVERVAVVGVGNVAIDVARILSLSREELAATDIADCALEALSQSRVKEIFLLGRRGPAQAAFTNPELKEVGELKDADCIVLPEEAKLDDLSREESEKSKDALVQKKVQILQDYAARQPSGKARKLHIRFLVSPVELIGDPRGRVVQMRLVKNVLYKTDSGTISPKATDQFEELEVGMVFRSVGYKGVALPSVPFNDRWGVILNEKGRVLDPQTQKPIAGLYTAGWIKRGPSGVIGTNKPDSVETVNCMLEDLKNNAILNPSQPDAASIEKLVRARQPDFFSYTDWLKIDEIEMEKGKAHGRPRIKFVCVRDMLAALGRVPSA